jgi:hypothetical protein
MLNTKESIPLLQEQQKEDIEKNFVENKFFDKKKKEEKREERYKLMMKALKEYNII